MFLLYKLPAGGVKLFAFAAEKSIQGGIVAAVIEILSQRHAVAGVFVDKRIFRQKPVKEKYGPADG